MHTLLSSLSLVLLTLGSALAAEPQRVIKLDWQRSPLQLTEHIGAPVRSTKTNCDCMDISIVGAQREQLRIAVDGSIFGEDSTRQLTVTLEDGSKKTLHYHFRVPIALELSSRTLLWQRGSTPTAQKLILRIPKGSPITKLIDAGLDKNSFHVATKTLRAGRAYEITLTPQRTDKAQLVRLIITTDSPYDHYKRYLVYLRVK